MSSMPIRGTGWMVMSVCVLAMTLAMPSGDAFAQNRNRGAGAAGAPGQPAPPKSAREAAPFDLTGYWVSVITEDWLERMTMPPKNFIGSLPVNDAARKFAASFDLAADKAAGQECRPHGAAGNIRSPGRLHFTWVNDDTLRIDFSAGTQTRTIPFKPATPSTELSWQGQSSASWNEALHLRQFAAPARTGRPALRVVTKQMKPGYLQRNGMPYSEQAVMTEFYDRFELDGTPWIVVTTQIDDPQYLREPLIWSTQFRKESDGSKWRPTACGET